MDQTTSAHQGFLRDQRERREDPDLDRRQRLRARGHHRKRLELEASLYQILQIFSVTPFRENPHFTGVSGG